MRGGRTESLHCGVDIVADSINVVPLDRVPQSAPFVRMHRMPRGYCVVRISRAPRRGDFVLLHRIAQLIDVERLDYTL